MESINCRIAAVVASSGLSKTAFAQRINVSVPFVCQMWSGASNPSDPKNRLICREYDVNETWLRTGEGEMIVARSVDDEIADYVSLILGRRDMGLQRKIISLMSKIPPDTWGVIVAKAQEVFSSGDEGKKKEEEQT